MNEPSRQNEPKISIFSDILRIVHFTDKEIQKTIFLQQSRIIYLLGVVLTLLYYARIIPYTLSYGEHKIFVYLAIMQGTVSLLSSILYRFTLHLYERIVYLFIVINVCAEFEIIIQTHLINHFTPEVMAVYISVLMFGIALVFPSGFRQFVRIYLLLILYPVFRLYQIDGFSDYFIFSLLNNTIIFFLGSIFHLYWIYLRYTNIEKTIALEKANQKLQELDGLKTRFFENISHELKTPITIIHAVAHERMKSESAEEKKSAEIILNHTLKLEKMVKNILELSRIQEGESKVNLQAAELTRFLKEISIPFIKVAQSKGMQLKTLMSRELTLVTDYEKLEIILYNLLSNAIKFSEGGTITLAAFRAKDKIYIRVTDQGIGIPAEDQEKIFSRFSRGKSALQIEGIGIGLALVREFVDILGGNLLVRSVPNKKTVFTISFDAISFAPLAQPRIDLNILDSYLADLESRKISVPLNAKNSATDNVLIVDDNQYILNMLVDLLGKYWNIQTCNSAVEANAALTNYKPNLIILDIMMPEMTGKEFLVNIRKKNQEHIPVILLSALSDSHSVEEGLALGADDYLAKPFNPDELILRVRNLLNNEKRKKDDISATRSRIFKEIHDNIGSELTDLIMLANQEILIKPTDVMQNVMKKTRNIRSFLKQSMNLLEDLDLMEADFLLGLNLFLLRRYSVSNRSLMFSTEKFQGVASWEKNIKEVIFYVIREITNHDLIYGSGESVLYITGKTNEFELLFKLNIPQFPEHNFKKNIIENRLAEIGGKLEVVSEAERLFIKILITC